MGHLLQHPVHRSALGFPFLLGCRFVLVIVLGLSCMSYSMTFC